MTGHQKRANGTHSRNLLNFIEKSPLLDNQYVVFRHQSNLCAVAITGIKEIIRVVTIHPVPEATPAHAGVINYRGEMISVVDLWQLLELPSPPLHADMTIFVLEYDQTHFGLLVNQIVGLWLLEAKPRPDDLKREIMYPLVDEVGFHDETKGLVFILNPERLHMAARDIQTLHEQEQAS
ncbi:chemotaxis protein CheW [bacterium]|nr:chemotaxis protein CheW [bacterium]